MVKYQIKEILQETLESLVQKGLLSSKAGGIAEKTAISLNKSLAFGDYSINTAMLLAKVEQKKPQDIAKIIASALADYQDYFLTVKTAGVGFINLTLTSDFLSRIPQEVMAQKERYGITVQDNPKKILVEFVSANPTGGLHLGHARPAFVGDGICRLLKAAGFDVTKEFYVNDEGNQIKTLAQTIHKRYQELFGRDISIGEKDYPGEYVKSIAEKLKKQVDEKFLDKEQSLWIKEVSTLGIQENLESIKNSLAEMDISFDNWFFESTLHESGALDEVFDYYEKNGLTYEADKAEGTDNKVRKLKSKAAIFSHLQQGGVFLKTSSFGDDEDRIIKRKSGSYVYFLADLAYHHDKYQRGFDRLIDVFGADHASHIVRTEAGIKALGHDIEKLDFITVQMVRAVKGQKEVKFSKRAGEVYGISNLIEDIGVDCARFVFLMKDPNTQCEIDLDILKQKNEHNPVFYVQYAHARMNNVLQKAQNEFSIDLQKETFSPELQALLELPEEREMLLMVGEFSEVIKKAAFNHEPHKVIYYSQSLVKLFHSYFTKYRSQHRILSSDKKLSLARVFLVYVVKQTLQNSLNILGISAPDFMEN